MTFFSHYYEQSGIHAVLTADDCCLEKVLEAPECFQECMSGNEELLRYLSQHTNLEGMIELMFNPPGVAGSNPDCLSSSLFADPEKRSRLAYIASEVFASDAPDLISAVTDSPALLSAVFSYMTQPPPLSDNKAYFSKVFSVLLRSPLFTPRVLLWFDHAKRSGGFNILTALFRHIDTLSVQALTLLTLGTTCDYPDAAFPQQPLGVPCTYTFVEWAFAHRITDLFAATLTADTPACYAEHLTGGQVQDLSEMTKVGVLWTALMMLSFEGQETGGVVPDAAGESEAPGGARCAVAPVHTPVKYLRTATAYLSSHGAGEAGCVPADQVSTFVPLVTALFVRTCKENPSSSVVTAASEVLQRVARAYTVQGIFSAAGEDGAVVLSETYETTPGLECLLKHSTEFKDLLSNTPTPCGMCPSAPLEMQSWTVKTPFGFMRLKLLELVRAIGLVDLQEVHRWLFDEGIVSLLMDLFERYDHNNLLHSLVIGALRSLVSLDDPTLDALIVKEGLPTWVAKLYCKGKAEQASYTGYLYELLRLVDSRGFDTGKDAVFREEFTAEGDRRVRTAIVETSFDEALQGFGSSDAWGAQAQAQQQQQQQPNLPDEDISVVNLTFPDLPPAPPAARAALFSADAAVNPMVEPDDGAVFPPAPSPGGWVDFAKGDGAAATATPASATTPPTAAPPAATGSSGRGAVPAVGTRASIDSFQSLVGGANPVSSPTSPVLDNSFLPPPAGGRALTLDAGLPAPTQTFSPQAGPASSSDLWGGGGGGGGGIAAAGASSASADSLFGAPAPAPPAAQLRGGGADDEEAKAKEEAKQLFGSSALCFPPSADTALPVETLALGVVKKASSEQVGSKLEENLWAQIAGLDGDVGSAGSGGLGGSGSGGEAKAPKQTLAELQKQQSQQGSGDPFDPFAGQARPQQQQQQQQQHQQQQQQQQPQQSQWLTFGFDAPTNPSASAATATPAPAPAPGAPASSSWQQF